MNKQELQKGVVVKTSLIPQNRMRINFCYYGNCGLKGELYKEGGVVYILTNDIKSSMLGKKGYKYMLHLGDYGFNLLSRDIALKGFTSVKKEKLIREVEE